MQRIGFIGALLIALALPAAAEDWATYESPRYGLTMKVPNGTKIATKDSADGWGLLYAESEGVKLCGWAQLGRQYSAKEIEAYGVKVTGIPADCWKQLDEGKARGKFTWYKTVVASNEDTTAVGIYGIGPRGSYLLLMITTPDDYEASKADYKAWYESITLHGGWQLFHAKDYGFTMLIPDGTTIGTGESGDWGALVGDKEGVKITGFAKKGEKASAEEIEEFGVEATGIDGDHWKPADKGKKVHGWEWYRTVYVESGDDVLVGIYGVGKGGSYLLLVQTTASDYKKNKARYDFWYEHIHLD